MSMKRISDKRCIIGEGPIWCDREQLLYFVNAKGNEICRLELDSLSLTVRAVEPSVSAMAFDKEGRLIVSRPDGVFILNEDDSVIPLYDTVRNHIQYANDMKVGPDGRIYVGTQSERRKGVSDKVDGKLYSIDKNGRVRVLLDGLRLSNGLDWSMDEKRFYHTDSDTNIIREYAFDKQSGDIEFTGREIKIAGVDGFTVDSADRILAACWGRGVIAVVDTATMTLVEELPVPARIPASCGFAGDAMDGLVVVTASYGANIEADAGAGFTYLAKPQFSGRKPYLFG